MDDNLIGDVEYAKELFRRMIPLRKRWISQASVQIVADDELLSLAARSGCRGLFIGFESLSDDNLRAVAKELQRSQDYRRVVEKLHRHWYWGVRWHGVWVRLGLGRRVSPSRWTSSNLRGWMPCRPPSSRRSQAPNCSRK